MKRDIVLSGIVAVAFHALILTGPLPTRGVPHGDTYKPVSLSIIHPEVLVSESSPEEAAPLPSAKPPVPPQPKIAPQQTPVPERKEVHKQPVDVEPPIKEKEVTVKDQQEVTEATVVTPESAEPFTEKDLEAIDEPEVDEGPHGPGGEIDEGPVLETASIQKNDSPDGLQKEGMAPGKGSPEAIIGTAIPTYRPDPHYPGVARRRGYEGKVVLEVEVLPTGKVGEVKIAKSSGFKVLDRSALKTVRTWRFPPGTKRFVTQAIIFDLKDT